MGEICSCQPGGPPASHSHTYLSFIPPLVSGCFNIASLLPALSCYCSLLSTILAGSSALHHSLPRAPSSYFIPDLTMDEHRSSSNVQSKLLPKTAGSDQRVSKVPVHPVHASKASRKGRPNVKKQSNAPKTLSAPVSIWGLCLMFNLVFLSMLTIPFVLLGLVTWEPVHFKSNGTSRLPVYNAAPPTGHYYTGVSPAKFALVSSWASTLVGNISSPFLILFSFLIARSLIPKAGSDGAFRVADDRHNMDQEHRVRELLHSRTYKKVWNWMKNSFLWGSHRSTVSGGICVAIVGVGFTLLFS